MKRAFWFGVALVGAALVLPGATLAAPKKPDPVKETPLKANPAIKPKVDKRIAPFTWGMTPAQALAEIDKQIDAAYAKKIAGAYDPKKQAQLEKEAEKRKKEARDKQTKFVATGGVSGYEMKAPGEFTYKNNESAIETTRASGGERQLFFINDKLWKVYDPVIIEKKEGELGDSWETALDVLEKDLGEKGKLVVEKTPSPSYFGTLIAVPRHYLWSDGTTQVRLVDHTKREDMPNKTVGLAYEQISQVEKLPSERTKIETKATDAAVDKAGYKGSVSDDKKKKPK